MSSISIVQNNSSVFENITKSNTEAFISRFQLLHLEDLRRYVAHDVATDGNCGWESFAKGAYHRKDS